MHCRRVWVLALLLATAGGCVASGAIKGSLKQPGQAAVPVTMHYRSERFGENGTMTATLPSGESFTGTYLQVTSDTSGAVLLPMYSGFTIGWPSDNSEGGIDSGEEAWVAGMGAPAFAQSYSGRVLATLVGDRGGRMRCRFHLSNPIEGMSSGGVGECQVSGGGRIDATF